MNISYSGYLDSPSGMGEAARNIIAAFDEAGVSVSTECVPNILASKDLGEAHAYCKRMQNVNIPYDVRFIHTTPDVVRNHMITQKHHIFHLFWETDKLPKWWVWELNHSVDEVWTGSEWNKQVFTDSGVRVPIFVCPQPVETKKESFKSLVLSARKQFLFGSVFQWIERKDPKTLITSFWREFQGCDDVGLLIKTYKENFSENESQQIVREVQEWKNELNLKNLPPVYLYTRPLNREDVRSFHATIDCFVSAHRGEGWGIPIAEAMVQGKPVVSTNLGGIHEHIPQDFWYPVNYSLVPVFNMDWVPWYEKDQLWGQVDENDLRRQMRRIYENREEAKNKGKQAQEFVSRNLNYQIIGEKMRQHLEEI